jgi:peptidoglycan-associated lipoprotein
MHQEKSLRVAALTGRALLGLGLFFIGACSQNVASDSSVTGVAEQRAGAQKFLTSAQSPSSQKSSLENHQDGTLGQGDGPLGDIHFDFDRYDLSTDAKAILQRHANWLKTNPQVSVQVEGHGDDRGTNEYNLALGAKRAENVKRYLADLGITAARMSTISYGEELPLCREPNEMCWAKNRRAHFVVNSVPTT